MKPVRIPKSKTNVWPFRAFPSPPKGDCGSPKQNMYVLSESLVFKELR